MTPIHHSNSDIGPVPKLKRQMIASDNAIPLPEVVQDFAPSVKFKSKYIDIMFYQAKIYIYTNFEGSNQT